MYKNRGLYIYFMKNTIYDIIFEKEKSCTTWLEEIYSEKEICIYVMALPVIEFQASVACKNQSL